MQFYQSRREIVFTAKTMAPLVGHSEILQTQNKYPLSLIFPTVYHSLHKEHKQALGLRKDLRQTQ